MKPKYELMRIVFISLLVFIIGGFTEAFFFAIYLHDGVRTFLESIGIDRKSSSIMVGAFAGATSIIIMDVYKKINKKNFIEIFKYPIIDILGLFIGTYVYILIFK